MTRAALRTLAVVAAVAVGAVGCAADDPIGRPAEVVLGVWAGGCSLEPAVGTGIAVEHDGEVVVLTSAHTIAGAQEVRLQGDGAPFPAQVIAFDPDRDIAVLRSPAVTVGRRLAEPSNGEAATVTVWRPDDGISSFATSIVRLLRVTIEDIYIETDVERRAFEFDGEITAGDSGAPVLDAAGNVLGIVYARSRSRAVGFAVSTVEVDAVLATIGDRTVDTGRCV